MNKEYLKIVSIVFGIIFFVVLLLFFIGPIWFHGDDQLVVAMFGFYFGIPSFFIFIVTLGLYQLETQAPIAQASKSDRIARIVAMILFILIATALVLGIFFNINVIGIICGKFFSQSNFVLCKT